IDDPCKYVKCPEGSLCIAGTGSCQLDGAAVRRERTTPPTGCSFSPETVSTVAVTGPLWLLGLLGLSRRRRRA
ncbi:MYXO-CTERM sorting domain-containing protein, partial [Klebsiella pneumoniae]|nr:MYXO-CTERM sorting domain-containing protein [Klebsiella pneumoniae]